MEIQGKVTRVGRITSVESRSYRYVKRLFDIMLSFILLLLFAPVILFVYQKIKSQEGKPVFYQELRTGMNDQSFIMYTFRTTTIPSRVIHGLPPYPFPSSWQYGVPNEFTYIPNPTVTLTSTGIWLKKHKLDKLPLLLHVLKGDMSFIGPEAELHEITRFYNVYQKQRLKIRPGITGVVQLADKQKLSYKQQLEMDLNYIKYRSWKKDVKILARTIRKLL
ncbi:MULTISPECIES: sugar transferase [Virgibacillus]|uniref:UDP-phosphate galactose phosphotransferase n=2 Tax=Virgibacillus TaxID=84406 RepID=A0ABQ2DNM8_9BACI|nr:MULTISPECIES: sugar transferase [Virgibacillus]EQB36809.1 hypothetical protein M948_10300 [Virgibacillus sp. CM-4]MYL42989.1 hypothetical protein [Virgibacillus massiliensis]GGJ65889.1 UDP-phosphate galactose phosphotransferase [Virgibacillus kapii]CDQ42103.1 putative sugar transferase EpsL [Virgibacillus massiliensis]